jgi:hypothetical protein
MMVRTFSTAFGLLMVMVVAFGSHGPTFVAAMLGLVAVLAGMVFRPAATLAVLLTVAAIALTGPSPVIVALSGLSAAVYLALRHATGPAGVAMTVTPSTIVAVAGFAFVGLVAASFPLQLPWLPALAPLAVFAMYVLVTRPFVR